MLRYFSSQMKHTQQFEGQQIESKLVQKKKIKSNQLEEAQATIQRMANRKQVSPKEEDNTFKLGIVKEKRMRSQQKYQYNNYQFENK